MYTAKINIVTVDEIGVMAEVVSVFTKTGINIEHVETKNIDNNFTAFEMEVNVESREELKFVMQKLRAKRITASCTRLSNEK